MVTFDKTIKEAHLIDAAIPNSHNLHITITEKLQQYTDLKEWACKNMATDNSLNNTTSTICNRYYSEQITQKYKAA